MKHYIFLFLATSSLISAHGPQEEITIVVHGTMGLRGESIKVIPRLFSKSVHSSSYKKRVLERRKNPQNQLNQAVQEMGLKKITRTTAPTNGAELFASIYDQVQKAYYPERKSIGYYTFGWSGILHPEERYKEAKIFYKELKQLVEQLKPLHPNLKIRIIAYSHGANVTLNMAEIHENHPNPGNFVIDELIMFGAPVQRETDCFITSPFFVNTYNIYSRKDCIQKLDCFSTIRLFSDRRFKDSSRCIVSHKVRQIDIRISIAADKDRTRGYSSKKRINKSPGHIELWNFCWKGTSRWYRQNFPFYPLPVVVFAPAITYLADTYQPDANNQVIELQPDLGMAKLRRRCHYNTLSVEFLPQETLEKLQQQGLELCKRCLAAQD